MASPQCEDGYLQIAMELVEKFSSLRIAGQEWQIIWTVWRKTWGWKKKNDRIALSQFVQATGIDRRKCHVLIQNLMNRNILTKSVTHNGDKRIIKYGFNKNFSIWKVSPIKVTVTHKDAKVSPIMVTTKERKIKTYSLNSFEIQMSELILNLILKRRPSFKRPDSQNWAKHIDLMIREDERDPEEIKKVIEWCQQDEFWQNNILSTFKLRKQFDQLSLKMEATNAKPKRFDEKDF